MPIHREIDRVLLDWKQQENRKPLLLRGAPNSNAEIDYVFQQDGLTAHPGLSALCRFDAAGGYHSRITPEPIS